MELDTLFFDLDATLYPVSNGLWDIIKSNIFTYMTEHVGIPHEEVNDLRQHYLENYGTSLAGLQKHYQVEAEHYLDFVHNIPVEKYIAPDPQLRTILESLPYRLWVCTNSDIKHARRVLNRLALEDLFEGVADMYAMEFNIKPSPFAYQKTLQLAGNPDPERCLFFDDLPRNLMGAKNFGFITVLVGGENSQSGVDYHLDDIKHIPDHLSFLWTREGLVPPQLR